MPVIGVGLVLKAGMPARGFEIAPGGAGEGWRLPVGWMMEEQMRRSSVQANQYFLSNWL